jgi:hypothetical protein
MRLTCILVVSIATVTAVMLGGAAAATADSEVVFCEANESLCAGKNIYPAETVFTGEAENPRFFLKGTLLAECPESQIEGSTTASMSEALGFTISLLSFGTPGKKDCLGCPEVHASTSNGIILMSGEGEFVFRFEPVVEVLNCLGTGLICSWGAEVTGDLASNEGLLELTLEKEWLAKRGGPCGKETILEMSAHYVFYSPDPVYLASYQL